MATSRQPTRAEISTLLTSCTEMLWQWPDLRRATAFFSAKFSVRVSRQRKHDRRSRYEVFVVKVGALNYQERQAARKWRGQVPSVIVRAGWPKRRK